MQPVLDWSAEHLAPGAQVTFCHIHRLFIHISIEDFSTIFSAGVDPRVGVGLQSASLWQPQLWGARCCRVPKERVL